MSFFFYFESTHDAYQIDGNEAYNTVQANFLSFYTPSTMGGTKRSEHFF